VLRGLGLALASNGESAVTAADEFPRVGQRVAVIIAPSQERLHPIPGRPVNQRLVFARISGPAILQLADVRPVAQNVVDRTPRELGRDSRNTRPSACRVATTPSTVQFS